MQATYIRVSTAGQNTITQENKAIGEQYTDKIQGITPFAERPQGGRLLGDIATGKVKHVFVNRIDRLGRNADDISDTIRVFKQYKCQLTITSMGNINLFENGKENFIFKMMVAMYAQIAEQQREEIKEKTAEGIKEAKKRGVYTGRKEGTTESKEKFLAKHKKVITCLESGMSLQKTADTLGVSKTTVVKVKKLLNS
ncbi:recombinase family protein [Marinifilum flexuosum]|uniref:recombinase family protein n=1 Tax=Marinifilum flexuosum TaxID=1117708 RepID=UPI002493C0AE|nr:recombinase family protein [Marinifilum flexuosum]